MGRAAIGLLVLLASPAVAQPVDRTEEALAAERLMFLPPPEPRAKCKGDGEDGAIVVCGRITQSERYRVPSSADDAPLSAAAGNTGVPHVGQSMVTSMPDCSPGHGCISGGWAPPPIYYIDLSKLPPPPPGSDADKIAKGEMRAP